MPKRVKKMATIIPCKLGSLSSSEMQIGIMSIIELRDRGILVLPVSADLKQKESPFDAEPAFGLWRDDPRTDEAPYKEAL